MKKICTLLCLFTLFLPLSVEAKPNADEFDLMRQAVEYSSQADSYSTFCEQEGTLSDDFIEKFEDKKGLTKTQKKSLLDLQASNKKKTETALKDSGEGCKSLDFMMQRLEIMRKLKDVSYMLNGVDPATLPKDNMPNIEDLLPPKSSTDLFDPASQVEDL